MTVTPTCTVHEAWQRLKTTGQGIETRRVWKRQRLFAHAPYYRYLPDSDVSQDVFERRLCLPCGSHPRPDQQSRIADTLKRALYA